MTILKEKQQFLNEKLEEYELVSSMTNGKQDKYLSKRYGRNIDTEAAQIMEEFLKEDTLWAELWYKRNRFQNWWNCITLKEELQCTIYSAANME